MAEHDHLLGLPLAAALARRGADQPAPTLLRTAPARPRRPLPEDEAGFRVVRVVGDTWVIAPAIPLP